MVVRVGGPMAGTVIDGVPRRHVAPRNCMGPVAPAPFTVPGGLHPDNWLLPWLHSILPIAAPARRGARARRRAAGAATAAGTVDISSRSDGDLAWAPDYSSGSTEIQLIRRVTIDNGGSLRRRSSCR